MDMIDGIIVGAAAAAIGSIIAFKFINKDAIGGGEPQQPAYGGNMQFGRPLPVYAVTSAPYPPDSAPVGQSDTPTNEAAFNVQPVEFVHAFGPGVNQPANETLLPI
jgi:hypothetical protein